MYKVELTELQVLALLKVASKESSRYAIAGIGILPNHGVAAATDGKVLLQVECEKNDGAKQTIMEASSLKLLGGDIEIEYDDKGPITISNGKASAKQERTDADFPDITGLVPPKCEDNADDWTVVYFNLNLLRNLCDAACKLLKKRDPPIVRLQIKIEGGAVTKAIRMDIGVGSTDPQAGVSVIMPMSI